MSFNTLITSLLTGVAQPLLKSMLEEVLIYPWIGDDGFGNTHQQTPNKYKGLVEYDHTNMKQDTGGELKIKARILILQKIKVPAGVSGRTGEVDERDRVVLKDGTSGPIISVPGLKNPATNLRYFADIVLGDPQ